MSNRNCAGVFWYCRVRGDDADEGSYSDRSATACRTARIPRAEGSFHQDFDYTGLPWEPSFLVALSHTRLLQHAAAARRFCARFFSGSADRVTACEYFWAGTLSRALFREYFNFLSLRTAEAGGRGERGGGVWG